MLRQHSHSDVDIRVDQELSRLFSGFPFHCTTPMPNWRVQEQTELAYEDTRSFFRLHRGVQCGRKKGTHEKKSLKAPGSLT
jgi:hypothetical protein